jgi:hypothetical protein
VIDGIALIHEPPRLKPHFDLGQNDQPDQPCQDEMDDQCQQIDRALRDEIGAPVEVSDSGNAERPQRPQRDLEA